MFLINLINPLRLIKFSGTYFKVNLLGSSGQQLTDFPIVFARGGKLCVSSLTLSAFEHDFEELVLRFMEKFVRQFCEVISSLQNLLIAIKFKGIYTLKQHEPNSLKMDGCHWELDGLVDHYLMCGHLALIDINPAK